MSSGFQPASIGSVNIQKNPVACVRVLDDRPPGLRLKPGQGLPNELVAVFNGYNGTMNLYVVSVDATRLIPVVS